MPYNFGFADAVHASLVQQRHIEIISNNLANLNTAGYKADRMRFSDLMDRQVYTDMSQGPVQVTGEQLDLAIRGKGFFQVRTPQGIRLTRAGHFTMDADGTLVTQAGYPVLGAGGTTISLNPEGGRVTIDQEGNITQDGEIVGRIEIVEAVDPNNLEKAGYNLWTGKGGTPPAKRPAKDYGLIQGALERSNAKVVVEMVEMIQAFRAFESYQKAIQVMQEIDTKAATQVGRVA